MSIPIDATPTTPTAAATSASETESKLAETIQSKSKDPPGMKILKLISFSPTRHKSAPVDCLLLEETNMERVANHLQTLLQGYGAAVEKIQPPELLFLLVYTVALECGFVPQKDLGKCSITALPSTSCFHSKNVMSVAKQQLPSCALNSARTQFRLPLQNVVYVPNQKNNAETTKALTGLLSGMVSGDFMIVTLTPPASTEISGSSLCLSIGRYVLNVLAKGKPIHQKFRKLDELAQLLRESVFLPVRNRQLDFLQISMYPSLNGLPEELYDEILQYLNRNQINVLVNVNRHLNAVISCSRYCQNKDKQTAKK